MPDHRFSQERFNLPSFALKAAATSSHQGCAWLIGTSRSKIASLVIVLEVHVSCHCHMYCIARQAGGTFWKNKSAQIVSVVSNYSAHPSRVCADWKKPFVDHLAVFWLVSHQPRDEDGEHWSLSCEQCPRCWLPVDTFEQSTEYSLDLGVLSWSSTYNLSKSSVNAPCQCSDFT